MRVVFLLCMVYVFFLNAQEKKIFVYGDFGYPESLDSITATKASEYRIGQLIFDSLLVQNAQGDFLFSLAQDIDISPDGLSYTFILRKNLKWADGIPLTAKDIEFTLSLMLNPQSDNYDSTLLEYVEDVVCLNPQVITVVLAKPFYSPLSLFTFKILPRHKFSNSFIKRTDAFVREPLGCGPFQYSSRKENILLFSQNPAFSYRKMPFLTEIHAKIYEEKKEAVQDLLSKKISLVCELPPSMVSAFEKNEKNFVLKRYQSRTIHLIAFNHRKEHRYKDLFQDSRIRKAFLHAIDREKILSQIFSDTGNTQKRQAHALISGPFPINSWAYNDKILPLEFQLHYAKQLLKEALSEKKYVLEKDVWKNSEGKPLSISLKYTSGDEDIENACKSISENFQKIGIDLVLEKKEEKKLLTEVFFENDFDLVYRKYSFDNTIDIYPLFDASRIGKGQSNFSGYVDPKLMELFYQLRSSLNPWLLRSISHKIHKIVHEENVHLFLWQLDIYTAYQKNVKNFQLHPYWLFHFPENWKIFD